MIKVLSATSEVEKCSGRKGIGYTLHISRVYPFSVTALPDFRNGYTQFSVPQYRQQQAEHRCQGIDYTAGPSLDKEQACEQDEEIDEEHG